MKYEHDSPAEWVREQAIALHTQGMDSGSEELEQAAEVLFDVERAMVAQAEKKEDAFEERLEDAVADRADETVNEWKADEGLPDDVEYLWRKMEAMIPDAFEGGLDDWCERAAGIVEAAAEMVGRDPHEMGEILDAIYKIVDGERAKGVVAAAAHLTGISVDDPDKIASALRDMAEDQ